jgi:glyoxylase-like metal-dependent hydrolase (beta-lactamase superfamily II)
VELPQPLKFRETTTSLRILIHERNCNEMRDLLSMPAGIVASMDSIARDVCGLRTVMVNVFAVANRADRSWVLIDTGLPMQAGRIRAWAWRHFGEGSKPSCILLTHGHFDHVGTLKELAREWKVPVYAHPMEMPYLTGRSKYPPPDPSVGGGAFALISDVYPRGPINFYGDLRSLPQDGSVPGLPKWRWIPTPGHSPGHISFFRDDDRVLIAGDAFVTTKQESMISVVTQRPELHGPPAYFTPDWEQAGLSVKKLAELRPNVVACGHGMPMVGPVMGDALKFLADHFDYVGVPEHGRYVKNPAATDERGVVSLPPRTSNPLRTALVGAAIAGAVVLALRRGMPGSYRKEYGNV